MVIRYLDPEGFKTYGIEEKSEILRITRYPSADSGLPYVGMSCCCKIKACHDLSLRVLDRIDT